MDFTADPSNSMEKGWQKKAAEKIQLSDPPLAKVNHISRRLEEEATGITEEAPMGLAMEENSIARAQLEMMKLGIMVTPPNAMATKETAKAGTSQSLTTNPHKQSTGLHQKNEGNKQQTPNPNDGQRETQDAFTAVLPNSRECTLNLETELPQLGS